MSERDRAIGTWLRKQMLIGRVWPVMRDPSPPVYALMTSRDNTLTELNLEPYRHDFGPIGNRTARSLVPLQMGRPFPSLFPLRAEIVETKLLKPRNTTEILA